MPVVRVLVLSFSSPLTELTVSRQRKLKKAQAREIIVEKGS